MQVKDACVYSDSITAINMIRGEQDTTSNVHHWIVQIQDMVQQFVSLYLCYIPRGRNRHADYLAKEALANHSSMLWLSIFPSWMLSLGSVAHCKCITPCNCFD